MKPTKTISYDPELESVAQANRDALVRVMLESRMPISAKEWSKWRPTKEVVGCIRGMPVNSIALATDGNLGIFKVTSLLGHNLGEYFIGHFHCFEWADGEGSGVPETLYGRPGSSGVEGDGSDMSSPEDVAKLKEFLKGRMTWQEQQQKAAEPKAPRESKAERVAKIAEMV